MDVETPFLELCILHQKNRLWYTSGIEVSCYEIPELQVQSADFYYFHWSCPCLAFTVSFFFKHMSLMLFSLFPFLFLLRSSLYVFGRSVVKHNAVTFVFFISCSFPPLCWLLSISHMQIAQVGHFYYCSRNSQACCIQKYWFGVSDRNHKLLGIISEVF